MHLFSHTQLCIILKPIMNDPNIVKLIHNHLRIIWFQIRQKKFKYNFESYKSHTDKIWQRGFNRNKLHQIHCILFDNTPFYYKVSNIDHDYNQSFIFSSLYRMCRFLSMYRDCDIEIEFIKATSHIALIYQTDLRYLT